MPPSRPTLFIALLLAGLALLQGPAAAAEGTGSITGSVTIHGKLAPEVGYAVISIEGIAAERILRDKWPAERKARMEQKDLMFVPHVLAVLVGTTVDFPNLDHVFHNVFSDSPVRKFDLGLYPYGKSRSITFDKPGVAEIRCNTHSTMKAYVVVEAQPYFTMPGAHGIYALKEVPLGSYAIKLWHPDYASISQPVTLGKAGEVLSLDFDLERGD